VNGVALLDLLCFKPSRNIADVPLAGNTGNGQERDHAPNPFRPAAILVTSGHCNPLDKLGTYRIGTLDGS
jgi:hypothetical protein